MPRTAISGLVCTTFLVVLGFPAVPQEPAGKGADTESGQLFACELRAVGDTRLGLVSRIAAGVTLLNR